MSLETSDQLFKRQEEILKQMREELKEKSNMFSSEHIENKVLTIITCENTSLEYHFESKFQARISLSDKSFEKEEK